jgi:hypothetical protein
VSTVRIALSLLLAILVLPGVRADSIRLSVEEPSGVARTAWPVTSGVPFAEGSLASADHAALFDSGGTDAREIPLQTEALALWPDGSVRWLLLDFQIDLAAGEQKQVALRFGPNVRRMDVENPIAITTNNEGVVTLNPGPVRLEYDPARFFPQGTAWIPGDDAESARRMTYNCSADGLVIVDETGHYFSPCRVPAEIHVEQAGPLRACIRVTGRHARDGDGTEMFRYVARIHAYRGQPWIRVFYTFENDFQDALLAKVQKIEARFWVRPNGERWADGPLLDGVCVRREGRVLQVDESHCLRGDEVVESRTGGWAATGGENGGLAVGLREPWQNWPTAVSVNGNRLGLELCPSLPERLYAGKSLTEESKLYYHVRDGVHALKIGMAKTREFVVRYLDGEPDAEQLGDFFLATQTPLLAVADPQYVCSTAAAGNLCPADPEKYFGYDGWLDEALSAHLARRDQQREYGLLNYGDWYGERSVNWGNLEYDLAHGLFKQYLRTGDRRFFDRASQAARHHIDVDVVHATNPYLKNPWGDPPAVGEIWLHCLNHTGGYYEGTSLPVSETYHMGHSTNFGHVWLSGDLDYYYLTGDRRAREVALQMADAMLRHLPTRYGTHIRSLGWPMIMMLHAYEATGNQKYLDGATENWRVLKEAIDWEKGWVVRLAGDHCKHGDRRCHGNVPFMLGQTLCALSRYHRLTGDPEVLRAITVGLDQMIRECWQEDVKTFRYTACPLSTKTPYSLFMLSTEAFAYEISHTNNSEHRRILREGFRAAVENGGKGDFGKTLGQMIHFTPHACEVIEQ